MQILDLFPAINVTSKIDNFNIYELKYLASKDVEKIKRFDLSQYDEFNLKMKSLGYDWSFEIEENNYTITQNAFNLIDIDELEDFENLTVNFLIFKKGGKVLIIDETEFFKGISKLGIEETLKIFNSKFSNGIIIINESKKNNAVSNYIGYNSDLKELVDEKIMISNQCNFNNFSDFKFTPYNFSIDNESNLDKTIELINRICQTFILIFIFDRSEIVGNEIKLKISGYKTLEYSLNFNKIDITSLEVYKKIFNWIYSEKNKVEDKIGIARNILSIYLKEENIGINDNTFNSILSANNTYIKGNISKYIETRNKIHEQIEQVSNKVNSSLETFYNNFQKSIFVFISFYLTIFILKVYTKTDPTSTINKEATIMALGLLILSSLFLVFSIWILSLEKNRIGIKYENVKSRAKDLLLEEDINKILDNDKEYNEEITFLDSRSRFYIYLWISTLIVFLIVLFSTSDYMNFKYL